MTTPVSGVTSMAVYPQATTDTSASTVPTSGSTSSSDTSGSTASSSTGSLLDPQAFLQLLVAQLQYQDPTNPTDTSTFMNQTAMLSQVQTMNSMSSTLQSLTAAQQSQSATAMIGKQVTWQDATGADQSGVVTGAQLSNSGASLTVGTTVVPLSSITAVSEAARSA